MRAPDNPLIMLGPTILFVFAGCFYLFWLSDKRQRHLLYFSISSALFCVGSLMQMLSIPASSGLNALLTAFLYALSVLMICDGILKRNGAALSKLFYIIVLALITSGIAYFYYIDRNIHIRIYILNFSFGFVFFYILWRLNKLRLNTALDRFLFWLLFAFALQFFVRTVLTVSGRTLSDNDFGGSLFWLALQYSLAVFGVALALTLLLVVVHDKLLVLKNETTLDPLTKMQNRRGFDEQADAFVKSGQHGLFSVVLLDVDHFKSINDTFGHACGDDVLRKIGVILKDSISDNDICARIGGEEFIVLMPGYSLIEAQERAEQIRGLIADSHFTMMSEKRKVTVSIGVASALTNESLNSLIGRADRSLYRAKNAGRNRVDIDQSNEGRSESRRRDDKSTEKFLRERV